MSISQVCIILVNYNGWRDTIECLESLLKLQYKTFKIIIVDNNSTNNSVTEISNWASGSNKVEFSYKAENTLMKQLVYPLVPKPVALKIIEDINVNIQYSDLNIITLIRSSTNLGFAGGNNLGIKLAINGGADYIWLLNNDTVVPGNVVTELVQHFSMLQKQNKRVGILGSKLKYYQEPDKIQAIIGKYKPLFALGEHIGQDEIDTDQYRKIEVTNKHYIVGAAMFISKEFIQEVGLMAEDYFLYYEEIDWINKAFKKHFTIDVCLRANVFHKEGASVGNVRSNDNKSLISDLYSIRNRILITKRYYKKYLISVYISFFLVIINRIKRKQFNRIIPIFKIIYKSLI